MKKYTLFLFILSLILLGSSVNVASASSCANGELFNSSTGQSCKSITPTTTTVNITSILPEGCTSNAGYNSLTGEPCTQARFDWKVYVNGSGFRSGAIINTYSSTTGNLISIPTIFISSSKLSFIVPKSVGAGNHGLIYADNTRGSTSNTESFNFVDPGTTTIPSLPWGCTSNQGFSPLSGLPCFVETNYDATSITSTSAVLHGELLNYAPTNVRFSYGRVTWGEEFFTDTILQKNNDGFSATLSNLTPNNSYQFKACAFYAPTNSFQCARSPVFNTLSATPTTTILSVLPDGCTSTIGYSQTTGESCLNTRTSANFGDTVYFYGTNFSKNNYATTYSTSTGELVTMPTTFISTSLLKFVIPQVAGEGQHGIILKNTTNTSSSNTVSMNFLASSSTTTSTKTTTTKTVTTSSTSAQVLGAETVKFTQLLKLGSAGTEVAELQKFLNAAGYDVGAMDGTFGVKTKTAVIKFQTANGLSGDGVVGSLTQAILNK